eukprot:c10952_g1_i1 orf=295-1806(-)
MAHLFHMESVCFSWSQKKGVCSFTDTYSLFDHCHDRHQSFFSRGILLRHDLFSSSPILPIFCVKSDSQLDSQTRARGYARSTKRDTQLRRDLQLFLSSQGLPPDKVPTTKQLSDGGREDLAKIVRRRGYKAIQGLLADSDTKSAPAQESNAVLSVEDCVNEASITTGHVYPSRDEQLPVKSGTPNDTGQIMEPSIKKNSTIVQQSNQLETASNAAPCLNGSHIENQEDEQLRMRAAEFVRTGRLDQLQDSKQDEEETNDFFEDSSDEEESVGSWDGPATAERIAVEKAANLRARLLPFLKSNAPGEPNSDAAESISGSLQKPKGMEEFDHGSIQIRPGSTSEVDVELQEIKSALISKEQELSEVSRDLEETKAQLALVQAKATAEVAQAKQVALEKDIRLKSADLALANLKRVQIEYWGEGGRVELAGSFNGWKNFIPMEPDLTSEISKPDGSRGPLMWETELWLYPGVYEIKFIVDGNWQVDQRREMVMKNSLHNNLLRVES